MPSRQPTLLAISTYEKGQSFLREAARLGARVLLLTTDKLAHADWPRDVLTRLFTMPEGLTQEQIRNTVLWLLRSEPSGAIDRIVPLDEFDLETAASLREYLRLPGMGQTATWLFRDKLAMRVRAREQGIPVPEFTSTFVDSDLHAFMAATPAPWLLKPRTSASAIGIHKLHHPEELWPLLDTLGDRRSDFLLERFVPGDIFHAEGVTSDGRTLFCLPFAYATPPMQTMHQGGIFSTAVLDRQSSEAAAITALHTRLLEALGLQNGVTHTEFIRSAATGDFLFLETAARVGGAYIAETCELASGLNPWVEWARLEVAAMRGTPYQLPPLRQDYAGSVISLARQAEPDTHAYTDPEIALRLHKPYHAGLLLQSPSQQRLRNLLGSYSTRFLEDFNAVLPAPDKPTS